MSVLIVIRRTAIGSGDSPHNYVRATDGTLPQKGPLFLLIPSFLPRIRTLLLLSFLPRSMGSLLGEACIRIYLLPKRQGF